MDTKTKEYYNKHAQKWINKKTDSFFHEEQFRQWIRYVPAESKVLDIGCASGVHVPLFLGIGRALHYTGVDVSTSMLKVAEQDTHNYLL